MDSSFGFLAVPVTISHSHGRIVTESVLWIRSIVQSCVGHRVLAQYSGGAFFYDPALLQVFSYIQNPRSCPCEWLEILKIPPLYGRLLLAPARK